MRRGKHDPCGPQIWQLSNFVRERLGSMLRGEEEVKEEDEEQEEKEEEEDTAYAMAVRGVACAPRGGRAAAVTVMVTGGARPLVPVSGHLQPVTAVVCRLKPLIDGGQGESLVPPHTRGSEATQCFRELIPRRRRLLSRHWFECNKTLGAGCSSVTPMPRSQRGVSAACDRPPSADSINGVPLERWHTERCRDVYFEGFGASTHMMTGFGGFMVRHEAHARDETSLACLTECP